MDQYFERIQQLLSRGDFPARIRFMIEDIIDLRNCKVNLKVADDVIIKTDCSKLWKLIMVHEIFQLKWDNLDRLSVIALNWS